MSIQEAIEILTQLNRWRRDENVPNSQMMPNPKEVGVSIDKAVEVMKCIVLLANQK
jgi:hypothetical protein